MIKNILKGIGAYSESLSLISKLKLWKYFAIPMVISLITAISIGIVAYSLSDNLGGFMMQIWPWEFGSTWVHKTLNFLSAIIIIVLGLIMYKYIVMALSAPFMSPVSEKIEAHLTSIKTHNYRNTSFKEQLWRGIKLNIRNLGKELLLTIPLLLLKLIPVVNIFSTVLLFLLQAYYAGFGNMDYTLERHFKYKESIQFVRRNRGIAIGNGIVFMFFLLIPVIGIILVLPMSVTAASLKTVSLLKQENICIENKTIV